MRLYKTLKILISSNNIIIIVVVLLLILFFIVLYYQKSVELFTNEQDNITVVSGSWNIKNKYGANKYDEWFKNTLNINQRYVFFCDNSNVEYIKSFRPNYEPIFVDYPLDMFYTNQFWRC